jgi:sugar/nucleoside kinase (ribokinase family)
MTERRGITSGGNWIVDRVKMVDRLPGRGMLGNIRSETSSTGGAPANVLADLSRMGAEFPLAGAGVIGRDADGDFVIQTAQGYGLDTAGLVRTPDAPTSYTDVMTEIGNGDRSFYHCRGANALFGPEHVDIPTLPCRIFHLGYLLLLDRMDAPDRRDGTVAASFLRRLQAAGIRTSVDVVSEEGDRFRTLVPPALRHVDYLIFNEIEAGRTVGVEVRRPNGALDGRAIARAVDALLGMGPMQLVAVHMPEGVYAAERGGARVSLGSLDVPTSFIKSKLGAGDALCAGMLYGLHEGWDAARCVDLGICCATACLADSSASGGLLPIADALKLAKRYPRMDPPVPV